MHKKTFEISEYGNLLMYDRKYSAADVRTIIETNQLCGLRIFDFWDPLRSLDFLREYTFLKQLEITCRDDQNFSFLSDLLQLNHFSVGPSHPMKNRIDLSAQANLRYLAVQWNTNKITGLSECRSVEDLCLVEFPNDDLKVVFDLQRIKRLRIKTGRMKSLEGIEGLKNLEDLEIGNCRRLLSISHLNGLEKLRRIRIESCRKIQDIESLRSLPSLSTLEFVNCGEIPDLDYDARFPNLKKVDVLGKTRIKNARS